MGVHAIKHIESDGVRLHQRRVAQGHRVRQAVGIVGRHTDLLTETAIAVYANHLQSGTDVRPVDPARVAGATADDRIDAYAVADLEVLDPLGHFAHHA
ncbi:hypothetical protein D3C85_1421980 [compost metagenome]